MLQSVPDPEAGCITMWAGVVTGVPPGWALCDGTNGTPNLRDKFIPCNGALFAVGSEGGSVSHTHSHETDTHTHNFSSGSSVEQGSGYSFQTSDVYGILTTPEESNTPPAYRLAYIMKLP